MFLCFYEKFINPLFIIFLIFSAIKTKLSSRLRLFIFRADMRVKSKVAFINLKTGSKSIGDFLVSGSERF